MTEPTIVIQGALLTVGQAMTVRVALNNFLIDLNEADALGDDEHGRAMTLAYKARIVELFQLMSQKYSSA